MIVVRRKHGCDSIGAELLRSQTPLSALPGTEKAKKAGEAKVKAASKQEKAAKAKEERERREAAEAKAKAGRQSTSKLSAGHSSKTKKATGLRSASSGQKSPEKGKPSRDGKEKIVVGREQYDYCHHCKQLKNVELLIWCKYATPACNQFVTYPYEPQCYTVNGTKIFNTDS